MSDGEEQAGGGEGLNQSQSRSLAVVLRSIEEALDRIEAALKKKGEDHLFYQVVNPYTAAEKRELQRIAARLREELRQCKERWRVPGQVKYLDAEIGAISSVLWSDLEESRPRQMRRYGEVAAKVQGALERDVEALSRLVVQLGRVRGKS